MAADASCICNLACWSWSYRASTASGSGSLCSPTAFTCASAVDSVAEAEANKVCAAAFVHAWNCSFTFSNLPCASLSLASAARSSLSSLPFADFDRLSTSSASAASLPSTSAQRHLKASMSTSPPDQEDDCPKSCEISSSTELSCLVTSSSAAATCASFSRFFTTREYLLNSPSRATKRLRVLASSSPGLRLAAGTAFVSSSKHCLAEETEVCAAAWSSFALARSSATSPTRAFSSSPLAFCSFSTADSASSIRT
mmetsp:Transcript_51078/g.121350  ORF Transcript_51078/g.121350 Transcript_51078/m.121350 type:complete len:255 (+) Transcript_51078:652-1416(+)